MGDAAVQQVVGVRRCCLANQQPGGGPAEEWIEVTVQAGDSCAVYRLEGDTPSITWDVNSRSMLINGRPLVEAAAWEEQSPEMPDNGVEGAAGTGMLLPPHVAAKSLASTALLNLTALAVGAGGVLVADLFAKNMGEDATVIKPPAPKNKPKF